MLSALSAYYDLTQSCIECRRFPFEAMHHFDFLRAYLVFVCGVERDLADLAVLSAELVDLSDGQLDALQEGRLAGVAVAFATILTFQR